MFNVFLLLVQRKTMNTGYKNKKKKKNDNDKLLLTTKKNDTYLYHYVSSNM